MRTLCLKKMRTSCLKKCGPCLKKCGPCLKKCGPCLKIMRTCLKKCGPCLNKCGLLLFKKMRTDRPGPCLKKCGLLVFKIMRTAKIDDFGESAWFWNHGYIDGDKWMLVTLSWWQLDVSDRISILVTTSRQPESGCSTLMLKDRGCWCQKRPKPSPTSQSCR